jgi:phosphoketolase
MSENTGASNIAGAPLSPEELERIHAYWRAANWATRSAMPLAPPSIIRS